MCICRLLLPFSDAILFYLSQIVAMVKDKLILPSSYGAVKIAGLYLLSDILHNAGAPVKHASAYRFVLSFSLCIVLHS